MSERIVWWNGKMIPESEARLSIYDSALMWGDMAFEMMRTFNKQSFKLHEHLERLFRSLNYLEIDIPYSFDELFDAHENLILHNREQWGEDDEVRSLINVSRGTLPIYQHMLNDSGQPNVIIACFPLREIVKGMSKFYKTGVKAIVASQRAIPENLLDPKIKSRSRQHYKMANIEIEKHDKEAWALLLDPDGFIAEGTGSNFFIVSNNNFELYTPEGRNCLRGVSRDYVMKLAQKLGMEVIEKNLTLYDVYNAREAFFTCTPYSILPCTSINGKPVNDGKVGKRTKYLMQKWSEDVGVDYIAQLEKWDATA